MGPGKYALATQLSPHWMTRTDDLNKHRNTLASALSAPNPLTPDLRRTSRHPCRGLNPLAWSHMTNSTTGSNHFDKSGRGNSRRSLVHHLRNSLPYGRSTTRYP